MQQKIAPRKGAGSEETELKTAYARAAPEGFTDAAFAAGNSSQERGQGGRMRNWNRRKRNGTRSIGNGRNKRFDSSY